MNDVEERTHPKPKKTEINPFDGLIHADGGRFFTDGTKVDGANDLLATKAKKVVFGGDTESMSEMWDRVLEVQNAKDTIAKKESDDKYFEKNKLDIWKAQESELKEALSALKKEAEEMNQEKFLTTKALKKAQGEF